MSEISFDIQGPSVNNLSADECRLVLELGETHLATMLLHLPSRTIVALRYRQFSANEALSACKEDLETDLLFGRPWASVDIFFHTRESVLLPESLYKGGDGDRILSMIHGDLRADKSMEDPVPGMNIRNIYRVPADLVRLFSEKFPMARCRHENTVLLQQLRDRAEILPASHVYLQVYPHQVTVTVIRDRQFILLQSYPYDIPEDVSYHLLNAAEQLELDPDQVPVLVSGLIDADSPLYHELLKYFRNLETDAALESLNLDEAFSGYPPHLFTPQTILSVCA
jgi:Protein of unknown function (DUF3822)